MAKHCSVCGKGAKKSATRSHSNIKSLRRQKPNLQKVSGMMVCTRCIKTRAKTVA